jgi:hypothetical protein
VPSGRVSHRLIPRSSPRERLVKKRAGDLVLVIACAGKRVLRTDTGPGAVYVTIIATALTSGPGM